MASDITCAECGEPIVVNYQVNNPSQREPCPNCGSTNRVVSISGTAHMTMQAFGTGQALTYSQVLLSDARRYFDDEQYSVAVIVAHMACEVAAARKMSGAFAARGVADLQDPVFDLLAGYNLGNERTRKLYTSLTGDEIQKQAFWPAFKKSADQRNTIIHRGTKASKAEAEQSLAATAAFVQHLGSDGPSRN
jgi:hypothetical protein